MKFLSVIAFAIFVCYCEAAIKAPVGPDLHSSLL